MKCLLIGYEGSQCIVPASRYLTNKYLPFTFDVSYVNYKGDIDKWASFLAGYLTALEDDYIIFALDDYLVADVIDMDIFNSYALKQMNQVECVKLCHCTQDEHKEYPVTTQWTIWNRRYLISLLGKISTPWQFEITGSRIFESEGKRCLLVSCLKYFTNSSISSRWEGIRLDGLKEEDIKHIKENLL